MQKEKKKEDTYINQEKNKINTFLIVLKNTKHYFK